MKDTLPSFSKEIAQEYGIRLAILFGSVAQGQTHTESDLDIAVQLTKPVDIQTQLKLISALSEWSGTEKIDLVVLNSDTPPLLLGELAQHGKLLHGNEDEFSRFQVTAMQQFLDFKPYFKLREELVHEQIAQL